jgi:hypothetical protein
MLYSTQIGAAMKLSRTHYAIIFLIVIFFFIILGYANVFPR